MTKTSRADLLQLILTTKFKKEYLKTQASEKDAFFMPDNQNYYLLPHKKRAKPVLLKFYQQFLQLRYLLQYLDQFKCSSHHFIALTSGFLYQLFVLYHLRVDPSVFHS